MTPQERLAANWPDWAQQLWHDVYVDAWLRGEAYYSDAERLADEAVRWAMRSKEVWA
jgi:hypothetical protein